MKEVYVNYMRKASYRIIYIYILYVYHLFINQIVLQTYIFVHIYIYFTYKSIFNHENNYKINQNSQYLLIMAECVTEL